MCIWDEISYEEIDQLFRNISTGITRGIKNRSGITSKLFYMNFDYPKILGSPNKFVFIKILK